MLTRLLPLGLLDCLVLGALLFWTSVSQAYPTIPPEYQYIFKNSTVLEPEFRWSTCGKAANIPCEEFLIGDEVSAWRLVNANTVTHCGFTPTPPSFTGYPVNGINSYFSWTDAGPNETYNPVTGQWDCHSPGSSWTETVGLIWYCPSEESGFQKLGWHEDPAGNVAGPNNGVSLRVVCVKFDPKIPPCVTEGGGQCKGPPGLMYGEGALRLREQDLPSAGPDQLEFSRNYRSDRGWSHGFSSRLINNGTAAAAMGAGRRAALKSSIADANGSEAPCYVVSYQSSADGLVAGCFAYTIKSVPSFKYIDAEGQSFDFTGNSGGYSSTIGVNHKILPVASSGLRQVLLPSNTIEQFDESGRLQSRRWSDGRKVHLEYSNSSTPIEIAPKPGLLVGAADSYGRRIQFRYDGRGLISTILDVASQRYDVSAEQEWKYSSVQGPASYNRTYLYNEPELTSGVSHVDGITGIIDEASVRFQTFGYDSSRRLLFEVLAGGVGRRQYDAAKGVTLPWGEILKYSTTTFDTLVVPWQVTRCRVDSSSCPESARQFALDTQGNWTRATDFRGMVTCRAVGARNLEAVRLEGLPNTFGNCPPDLAGYPVTPPLPGALPAVRKITTQWHPYWRLRTREAHPKLIISWVFNGQSDPSGNVVTCAPADASVTDGVPIAVLCKRIEQGTSDETGTLGFAAAMDGLPRVWNYTYNAQGQMLTAKGPRTDVNDTTTYSYYTVTTADYTQGDLERVTNPVGHVTRFTKYNAHGRPLQVVDANNLTIDIAYDERMRMTSVNAGGELTSVEYWPTGLLKKATLPDGSWVAYQFDDAHRLTGATDNLGNTVTYRLDNAGQSEEDQVKDANGVLRRKLNRVFDKLGRVEQLTGRE